MSCQVVKTLLPSFGKTNLVLTLMCVFSLFRWFAAVSIDIQDNYRIILFEGSERLDNVTTLKSHLTLIDGPVSPSAFYKMPYCQCLPWRHLGRLQRAGD